MTRPTTTKEIQRAWHVVDVKDQVLGRISTTIAHKLMGKNKSYFTKNLDCGDYVVVINAKDVKVTGKKATEKMYNRHSGYPGGFKAESFQELMAKDPREVIRHSVKGMLPNNKLQDTMLKRLFVFPGEEHTYEDKLAKGEK